jgi:hypothetical protein
LFSRLAAQEKAIGDLDEDAKLALAIVMLNRNGTSFLPKINWPSPSPLDNKSFKTDSKIVHGRRSG